MDPHYHHQQPCHLIHHQTTTCHLCYTPPPPPPPQYPQLHFQNYPHTHPLPQPNYQNYPYNHQPNTHVEPQAQDQAVISSLVRRITALESSLSHKDHQPQYPQVNHSFPAVRNLLRDAAARMIQTHFRVFLVRRSRTLRQLKTLAEVKSSLNGLKMMVAERGRVDLRVVSRKAMDLLLKIDSIEGCDTMIRDGKKSISRDLDRFLSSIGLSVKKKKPSSIEMRNTKARVFYNRQQFDSRDKGSSHERMRARVESSNVFYHVPDDYDDEAGVIELENFRILNNGKIGSLPKRNGGLAKGYGGKHQGKATQKVTFAEDGDLSRVFISKNSKHDSSEDESVDGGLAKSYGGKHQGKAKKKVTFSENGDHSRVFISKNNKHDSSEDELTDEEMEMLNNLQKRVQKIAVISDENGEDDQEAYSEDEESSQISNGEDNPKRAMRNEVNYEDDMAARVESDRLKK